MKQLVVMRHADAAMAYRDIERQLSDRGLRQATDSGHSLKEVFVPDLVLVSPATRTTMTFEQVAAVYDWPHSFATFVDSIYNASKNTLKTVLKEATGDAQKVLVIAHNPGVSELVCSLTGSYSVGYSPGTYALLESSEDTWEQALSQGMSLKSFYSPL